MSRHPADSSAGGTGTGGSPPARVLVVDDEALAADAIARFLGRKGYRVETSGDGESALMLASAARPDIVITDLRMPGLLGGEFIRRLKAKYPGLPVIVLTGQIQQIDDLELIRAEAAAVIHKPVDLRELGGLVARALSGEQP